MLTLDEAQARLLKGVVGLPAETLALTDAVGRFAADPVTAKLTQPPFAASAMDGYAIRWVDRPGPWRVVGESAAGARFSGQVEAGQAVRIFTGAPVPSGADTVVVQEDMSWDGDVARLTGDGPPHLGAHIRRKGLDFTGGMPVVACGDRLAATRIGLLAASGHGTVSAHRRPRLLLLSTGSELVPAGQMPGPDQIISSNGPMLSALLRSHGADVTDGGIIPDDRAALAAAFADAIDYDLIVTVGGASVGDHDLVLPVLNDLGAQIDFWKVAIKPGKPMLSGHLRNTRVVGLPGNPVSATVCTLLFVVPMVRAWLGDPSPLPKIMLAATTVDLPANGNRRDHLRALLALEAGRWIVTPAHRQDSSMLRVLADSNALLVRPEYDGPVTAGQNVPVLTLDTGHQQP
jgi:molybdopterin molybdotransferase